MKPGTFLDEILDTESEGPERVFRFHTHDNSKIVADRFRYQNSIHGRLNQGSLVIPGSLFNKPPLKDRVLVIVPETLKEITNQVNQDFLHPDAVNYSCRARIKSANDYS